MWLIPPRNPPPEGDATLPKDLNARFGTNRRCSNASRRTPMADEDSAQGGLRDKIARSGEDALGKIAQELLENPLVNSAIAKAFEARERAVQAQEATMGAL